MKFCYSLFIILLALACSKPHNNSPSARQFDDPNASINKTDIPRTLNANNATNSTPGDWIDGTSNVSANTQSSTKETGKSSNDADNRIQSEASAVDNLSNKGNDNKRTKTE